MLVGLVGAGLLTFPQTLGLVLGSGLGTSITVQILSLSISQYARSSSCSSAWSFV